MRRKALKHTQKKLESSPFGNPESTELESGIQYPESGIHSVESRIQDSPGFPYMGRSKDRKLEHSTQLMTMSYGPKKYYPSSCVAPPRIV